MLKKLLKGMLVGGSLLALVVPAQAATELNMYGASAQHEFWNAAVPAFMADHCTYSVTNNADAKNGATLGTGCDFGVEEPVVIRYSSKNSSYGVGTICGLPAFSGSGCAAGETNFCSYVDNGDTTYTIDCANKVCATVSVGASDVEKESFAQTSPAGFEYTYPVTNDSDETCSVTEPGNVTFAGCTPANHDKAVVVPFGFLANNDITVTRCLEPLPVKEINIGGTDYEAHYAYPRWGWQCVPDANGQSDDCLPMFKCQDDGTGRLSCGGVPQDDDGTTVIGNTCAATSDCAETDLAATKCEAMPIDNLSRLMAIAIFSQENANTLQMWSQFGPWYPANMLITRCMRCAGSGTHATLDLHVFRGDAIIQKNSIFPYFYHHASSSDLTKCIRDNGCPGGDCMTYLGTDAGALGYVDVDKILGNTSYPDVHVVKYQGVEPLAAKITNCEYNFWAAQSLYWNTLEPDEDAVFGTLLTFAQNATNIATYLPERAAFWTAAGELNCDKIGGEDKFPRFK